MPTRAKTVWYHVILPLTTWLYLPLALVWYDVPYKAALLGLVFAATVLTAIAGYLTNDLFDQREDRLAQKPNFFNRFGTTGYVAFVMVLLAAIGFWYLLLPTKPVLWLLLAEGLLLLLYSLPGLRLKHNIGGVLADALYSRVVPSVVLLLLVVQEWVFFDSTFWLLLIAWQLAAGLRNILLHQLDDRKKDRLSGNGNWALRWGPKQTANVVLKVLLPLELALLLLWGVAVWRILPGAPFIFTGLLGVVSLCYLQWEPRPHTAKWWRHKWRYLPNHLYEEWLPLLALTLLALNNTWFWLLFAAHIVLFYRIWPKYLRVARLGLSRIVNFALYYLFLAFGVDLRQSNRSAWQHFGDVLGRKNKPSP